MEDCIHSHFPRSHKAANHFQISMAYVVLEDNIVGEADSPIRLARCNGSRLYRCTVVAVMSWGLAVDRLVGGRGAFVSRSVSRWPVAWCVLCWAVVAWGVGAGGIVLRSIISRGVVCWGVCARTCVLRHKVLAAVLHYCYDYALPPPLHWDSEEVQEKKPKLTQNAGKVFEFKGQPSVLFSFVDFQKTQ